MSNPEREEYLEESIQEICSILGFGDIIHPDEEEFEETGELEDADAENDDFDENLTDSLYILSHVFRTVCGMASMRHYLEKHPECTEDDVRKFAKEWSDAHEAVQEDFLDFAGKLILWEPKGEQGKE